MARGRFLLSSEYRRRAASVPAEHLSYAEPSTTSKLYDIRSHVASDTDSLASASKRHDRDFLRNVQTRLASPTLTHASLKISPTLNHNKARGPPPSRSSYFVGGHVPRDTRRRTWYGPTSNRVDDYEVAAYLATPPVRLPYLRSLRSGSVPPVLPSTASAPRWYASSARGASVPRLAPSTYPIYGGSRSYLRSHPDMEDLVIGVAPTALYGDIVIGIPYRKQFMFNVQHGQDAVEDYRRIPVATRVTSSHFAHKHKPWLESSYEDDDVIPHRRATYATPHYVPRRSSYWYPSTHYLKDEEVAPARSRISHYGYQARNPAALHHHGRAEYDLDLGRAPPSQSLSNLRSRASLVREQAKEHKHLIDRYLPVDHLGPSRITVKTGFEETGYRKPVSTAYPGSSHEFKADLGSTHQFRSHSTAAAAPASTGTAPTGYTTSYASKPFKPQISETRQRVRDLLCKAKKDPHYFD